MPHLLFFVSMHRFLAFSPTVVRLGFSGLMLLLISRRRVSCVVCLHHRMLLM